MSSSHALSRISLLAVLTFSTCLWSIWTLSPAAKAQFYAIDLLVPEAYPSNEVGYIFGYDANGNRTLNINPSAPRSGIYTNPPRKLINLPHPTNTLYVDVGALRSWTTPIGTYELLSWTFGYGTYVEVELPVNPGIPYLILKRTPSSDFLPINMG